MRLLIFLLLLSLTNCNSQSPWASEPWTEAANLTALMDSDGVTDLSGLHWNGINNRLYCVQGDGRLRVLQLNTTTNIFSQIANKSILGGHEGITQANLNANEFYTIDENNYEIRRYTHTTNFSSVTLVKHWDLLASPSPMEDTGNSGPEGIVFIPDNFLVSAGFISQQTGQLYISQKGMGGLFFIAHQDQGFVWVFDVNPNTNDDFTFVGMYTTNKSESCDISFDRGTGLLYILHNITGENTLEITSLATTPVSGNARKFVVTNEYSITNPTGANDNIEGFAITSKCPISSPVSVWLCRDVENNENNFIKQDVLRWFQPFEAAGDCTALSNTLITMDLEITIFPNPADKLIAISIPNLKMDGVTIEIVNSLGQTSHLKNNFSGDFYTLDVSEYKTGIYFVKINTNEGQVTRKFLKK